MRELDKASLTFFMLYFIQTLSIYGQRHPGRKFITNLGSFAVRCGNLLCEGETDDNVGHFMMSYITGIYYYHGHGNPGFVGTQQGVVLGLQYAPLKVRYYNHDAG